MLCFVEQRSKQCPYLDQFVPVRCSILIFKSSTTSPVCMFSTNDDPPKDCTSISIGVPCDPGVNLDPPASFLLLPDDSTDESEKHELKSDDILYTCLLGNNFCADDVRRFGTFDPQQSNCIVQLLC